jgi:hypothetical protein
VEELSLAVLRHDLPVHGLIAGDIGTIVLVHNDGEAYEVEFLRSGSQRSVLLTLTPDQIGPLAGGRASRPQQVPLA